LLGGKKEITKIEKREHSSSLSKSFPNLGSVVVEEPPLENKSSAALHAAWFVGKMERKEAEALLKTRPYNSFLIRVGSIQGCFAISKYNVSRNLFNHVLISTQFGGFVCQDSIDTTIYQSLNELVDISPEVGIDFRPVYEDAHMKNKGKFEYVDFNQMDENSRYDLQHLLTAALLNTGDKSQLQMLANLINYNLNGDLQPREASYSPPPIRQTIKKSSSLDSTNSSASLALSQFTPISRNRSAPSTLGIIHEDVVPERPQPVRPSVNPSSPEYIWYEHSEVSKNTQPESKLEELKNLYVTFPRLHEKFIASKFNELNCNTLATADFLVRF